MIVGNGVMSIPPHDLEQPYRWYFRVYGVNNQNLKKWHGITSVPNIMNFRPAILWLSNTKYFSEGSVWLGYVRLGMRMRRWLWIVASSTFHLTTSSNCNVGVTECSKLKCIIFGSGLRRNVHTEIHKYTSNHSLVIKCLQTDIISEVVLG
jgi:hypothetical protein